MVRELGSFFEMDLCWGSIVEYDTDFLFDYLLTLKTNIPAMEEPQFATVSASRKPGVCSSHWLVLIGMCFLSKEPGRVVASPALVYLRRRGANRRSMVAAEILSNNCFVCSERSEVS